MKRPGPVPFLVALLLHVGVFLLAFIGWTTAPKLVPASSVPVEIVSSIPSHEMAEAPVDKLAVKTPEPIPAPEEEPVPAPPVEAPKQPVPVPQKAVTPPPPKPVKAPTPTPTPPKVTPAPPDKNGLKKPVPTKPAPPVLDLGALSQLPAQPSKAQNRRQAQANTHPTNGASQTGAAPADVGPALSELGRKLSRLWSPACDVPGSRDVVLEMTVTLSPNGRVINGPTWTNPRKNDPIWVAAFNRAAAAVSRGQQLQYYINLPDGVYNQSIPFTFDAQSACRGQ